MAKAEETHSATLSLKLFRGQSTTQFAKVFSQIKPQGNLGVPFHKQSPWSIAQNLVSGSKDQTRLTWCEGHCWVHVQHREDYISFPISGRVVFCLHVLKKLLITSTVSKTEEFACDLDSTRLRFNPQGLHICEIHLGNICRKHENILYLNFWSLREIKSLKMKFVIVKKQKTWDRSIERKNTDPIEIGRWKIMSEVSPCSTAISRGGPFANE